MFLFSHCTWRSTVHVQSTVYYVCVYVCFSCNQSLDPGCQFPNSRYDHICCWCILTPLITNKHHKALYCPSQSQQALRPLFLSISQHVAHIPPLIITLERSYAMKITFKE